MTLPNFLGRVDLGQFFLGRAKSICGPLMYTTASATVASSDGRVVRAFASGAVDLGVIPSRVTPTTFKWVVTVFLLDVEH